MGLKKAENQVKILLADTIMALCRNTLNQHAEISVEGLLGITLDNDEIFLVSLNQTIKNPNVAAKKRSIEQDNNVDRKDSKKSRKDSDNDQDSDSESEKKPRRRKRHKKRRSRSSAGESESSSEGEGSDTTIEENSYNAAANSTDLTDVTNSQNVVRIKREQDEDEDEDLVIVKEELSENIPSSSAFPFMAQSFQGIPQLHGTSLNNFQPNSSMNESISSHNPPMHISPHPQPGTSVSQSGHRNFDGDNIPPGSLRFGNEFLKNEEETSDSIEYVNTESKDFVSIMPGSNANTSGASVINIGGSTYAIGGSTVTRYGMEYLNTESKDFVSIVPGSNANTSGASVINIGGSTYTTGGNSNVMGRTKSHTTGGSSSFVLPQISVSASSSEIRTMDSGRFPTPPGCTESERVCPLCSKTFQSPSHLRRHYVVHTRLRRHLCQFCGRSFGLRSNMVRHCSTVHKFELLETQVDPNAGQTMKPDQQNLE